MEFPNRKESMLTDLLKPEIEELIAKRAWGELKDGLSSWHSAEVADLLLSIDRQDRVLLYRVLPRDFAADVFAEFDQDDSESLLESLTDAETRELLEDLSPDDRTALLEELPAEVTRKLLSMLSPSDLKEARLLLGYPEDSVGRLMTPDFISVKEDWTVAQTLSHIRKYGKDSETLYRIYVRDEKGKLIDDIMLRNLILADEKEKISSLMDYNVVSIPASHDQEEAVRYMDKYDVMALPVVDSQGKLLGIVTFDDVMDVHAEEVTEDFQKLGGVNPVDQAYLSASVPKMIMKRFPWLLALVLVNFLTAGVIDFYSDVTLAVVALASFIPLLIGTAGNSGTQSATLIIRGLAVGEVRTKDLPKILRKELSVGLSLGVIFGLVTYLRGMFEGQDKLDLALVISLTMLVLVVWANLIGAVLPIILAKLKLDPAVISSPLIATLIDVTGILIYYNIAIYILNL